MADGAALIAAGISTVGLAIALGGNAVTDFQKDWESYEDSKSQLKKVGSNSRANEIAKEFGYDSAEDFKEAIVGKKAREFNIKYDPKTNEIILESIKGGIQVPTGYFMD